MQQEVISKEQNIVFFDGVCNMCNGLVTYLMKKDQNHLLYYSSLQSEYAKDLLKKYNVEYDEDNMQTIYFFNEGKLYSHSTAILKIIAVLNPFYSGMSKFLLIINKTLRDKIYGFVSKNRYKFFGKKNTCRLPTKEEASRFLQ